jgi:CelD/BcsL family acetyltransferase involved in cellulose biosynthesis
MNVALRQDEALSCAYLQPTLTAAVRIARVEVFDSLETAEPAWRQLEASGALMTPYQRFEWASLWHNHVTGRMGIKPFIVVASDEAGTPLFLLPLSLRSKRGMTIAGFFGGRHSNLNSGIWRRDVAVAITADEIRAVLAQAAEQHNIDLLKLVTQPATLHGVVNPLALFPSQPTPDDVYVLTISGDTGKEALKACLKSSMIGRLRTKERKLQALEGYRYLRASTPADADRILNAFFVQKSAHLQEQGISNVFDDAQVVDFLRAGCHEGLDTGKPVIELHALEGGGEVLAVFGGVNDGRRLSCMFNSYTSSENGRWSPGLILLTHLVTYCGDTHIDKFDLGAGHAFYKTIFCKDTEGAFDTILGFSARGKLTAASLSTLRDLKRRFKSTPALWNALKSARRLIKQ